MTGMVIFMCLCSALFPAMYLKSFRKLKKLAMGTGTPFDVTVAILYDSYRL